MTNPYDIHEDIEAPRAAQSTGAQSTGAQSTGAQSVGARADSVRPVLWVLLVISAAGNMVTSSAGLNVLVGIGFGLVTLACIAGLVVDHYSHRSR